MIIYRSSGWAKTYFALKSITIYSALCTKIQGTEKETKEALKLKKLSNINTKINLPLQDNLYSEGDPHPAKNN